MTQKPPIPSRDRGGRFSINNPDDDTPIREMFELSGALLLITDKCTYQVRLADQIDPQRTNPKLPPNVQQKVFDHGVYSELLCRTLLQAKVLFRKYCSAKSFSRSMWARHYAFHSTLCASLFQWMTSQVPSKLQNTPP